MLVVLSWGRRLRGRDRIVLVVVVVLGEEQRIVVVDRGGACLCVRGLCWYLLFSIF